MTDRDLRGREATENRLAEAAVDLIKRDGILAGLNLREVADGAGVNRGNIYHYFGSRKELLRKARITRFEEAIGWLGEARDQALVERKMRVFRSIDQIDTNLLALLVIDGDETADPLPDLEHSIEDLQNDVTRGHVHPEHDLEALQVAFQGAARGYAIFKNHYASRIEVSVEDLDERVARIMRHWLESVRRAPSEDAATEITGPTGGEPWPPSNP